MLPFSGNGDGGKTATAGTAIQYLVPPNGNGRTRMTTFVYTSGGTQHTLTFLRPLGLTKVNGAAASGQAVVNITADPGATANSYGGVNNPIAANDFVAIREKDGITRLYKVSSVSTLAITLATNLVAGCVGGESFWDFGVPADTDGRSGSAHPALKPTLSADTTYTDRDGGVVASYAADEPILINSDNPTAAGTFKNFSWAYTIN